MKKFFGIVVGGIMAGFTLSISCAVKLSVENGVVGAFLFSLGLFTIITFGFGLYTGKAGYAYENGMVVKPSICVALKEQTEDMTCCEVLEYCSRMVEKKTDAEKDGHFRNRTKKGER